MAISITDFGAVGNGTTDNRAALQRAFDYARANGEEVYIPPGVFAHSGTLSINGIKVSGAGESSVLKATQYGQEALILRGDGVSLSDFRIEGVNGSRLSTDESAQIIVQSATNFAIENIHIVGSSSAGIKVNNSGYGHIADNVIENTKADSIHMVLGSHDIVVENNRINHSGDDGISVVSYRGGGLVHHITIRDNEVVDNTWGRGITVLGGGDVVVEHNYINGGTNDRAGVYIAAETEWNTEGVRNVRVSGNTLVETGGTQSGHGAITVYNSQAGGQTIDGVTITNNDIVNPLKMGILALGSGAMTFSEYENRVTGTTQGALVDLASNSTINRTRPSGETNIVGTDGVEQLTGTTGGQALYGRGGDDTLRGEGGDDLLVAGAGGDSLFGGAGNDRLFGDDGNDKLDGGAGTDYLHGGAGPDTFVFTRGSGSDTIRSFEAGSDKLDLSGLGYSTFDALMQAATVTTGPWTNGTRYVALDFGNGDKLQVGGVGALTASNVILSGSGSEPLPPPPPPPPTGQDTLKFRVSGDSAQGAPQFTVFVDGVQVGGPYSVTAVHSTNQWQEFTVTGSFGTAAHNVEVRFINDFYSASVGDRNLYVDYLQYNGTRFEGEAATDTASQGRVDPVCAVMLSGGTVAFSVPAQTTPTDPPPPVSGDVNGTTGADTLAGTTAANTIFGDKGDDRLTGGGGHDTFVIRAGDGSDTIADHAGPANATEADTIRFSGAGVTVANLQMLLSGTDTILSFDGVANSKVTLKNVKMDALDNLANGTYGLAFEGQTAPTDSFDVLKAGTQISQVARTNTVSFLNDLNNKVDGRDNSNDVINGQGGHDTLRGMSGDDILRGDGGNDQLYGGGGTDRLEGGNGDDKLLGEAGNDVLIGGAGNDWMDGGAGTDTFVFARGSHADIVSGFQVGSDKLDLSAFGFGDMAGLAKSASVTAAAGSSTLWIDFGGGDRLTVFGIGKLTTDNVIF